jgi:hypothetical protein
MGMRSTERVWTQDELAALAAAPGEGLHIKDVAAQLGRSRAAVATKASVQGIRFPYRRVRGAVPGSWTKAELDILAAAQAKGLSMLDVARETSRTHSAVKSQAALLGIRFPRRPWTLEEDEFLQEVVSSSPYLEIAQAVGRTLGSVQARAYQLGLNGRKVRRGPEHHNYRGGPATAYRTGGWPQVRQQALERDGHSCQDCRFFSPSGRGLVVHHVIPWRLFPVHDLEWLTTLCKPDHLRRPEHWWRAIPEDVQDSYVRWLDGCLRDCFFGRGRRRAGPPSQGSGR